MASEALAGSGGAAPDRGKQLLFWLSLVLLVALDQFVKLWARQALHQEESLAVPWPGVFEIKLTYNEGIAFGFFQGKGVLMTPVAILIACGAAIYTWRHPEESRWNHVAFGMLGAGAVGNLVDRLIEHRVTDVFWFRAINFPVFNVADSCITVATAMLIIGWWSEAVHRKSHRTETPAPSSE